jgi:hypothetical protein
MRACLNRFGTAGLIAAIAMLTALPTHAQQPPDLLQGAKRIVRCSGWMPHFYWWRGPHTVIALIGVEYPAYPIPHGGPVTTAKQIVQVNTETGEVQPLTALTQRWKQRLVQHFQGSFESGWRPLCTTVSPDGKWMTLDASLDESRHLILRDTLGKNTPDKPVPYQVLISMDGAESLTLPFTEGPVGDVLWSRDSQTCILLDGQDGKVGFVDIHTHRVERRDYAPWLPRYPGPDATVATLYDLRGDGDGFLVPVFRTGPRQDGIDLFDFGFQVKSSSEVHRVRVDPPASRSIQWFELSPDGKRIAWYMTKKEKPEAPMRGDTEVWISQTDATQMRMLGVMPRSGGLMPYDAAPRWMPDSKHLSMIYQGALYSVPVD